MKKKIIAASLAVTMTLTSVAPAMAAPTDPVVVANQARERIPVLVNDLEIDCDQPPVIVGDRTLVPLRAIFEALGAAVYWDNDTRSVTATRGETTVLLIIGSMIMYKDGQPVYLDVPGQIINSRTMVPVRAVSESFGSDVYWDDNTRTVRVYTDAYQEPTDPENPVQPEYPEVDDPTPPENIPPEEEQPVVDEREAAYNTALLQLKNGYSYEAYYGFQALGNYKDSSEMMEQALWLNRISMDIVDWGYSGARDYDWYKTYTPMTDNEIYNALINKTFYTPSAQSPQFGATLFKENNISYYLGDNTALNTRFDQGNWYIAKNGVFLNAVSVSDSTIYGQTFIKLTDGLYANIISDQYRGPSSRPYDDFFFDASSVIGQGLRAYYDRYDYVNGTTQSRPDASGIYYLI